ncbi:hypothetical protein GUITHDRAFT_105943 [Guillardia theta CCMP2712]|uniref:EF-hand domain-containing protein n=1 Tax=Guillardia theta (strain CCMP2712) TaxID=905079 RepID=L1JIN2_GUITC|nr:hypothetical protein GUITHDRAFT_105943 [Guillardia theta CCMP2712]EKX48336.1 hypothetical protein GUITHDRAFT_105943 [Guillardia theta CCMP2712]|eukprot:XP_005835316.1 hypothetical protein GUITHDRAFT_105943 [Guillardia theta CCMP2712]
MPEIDFKAAGEASAADLIRKVLGHYAMDDVQGTAGIKRQVLVGHTGVSFLDVPHVWVEGEGWKYCDDKEHDAFEEIHWYSTDVKGKRMAAEESKKSKKNANAMLRALGLHDEKDLTKLRDQAVRVFRQFDDDNSGKLTASEIKEAFENLGMSISLKEVRAMIDMIDDNGDGMVDEEEFCTLVFKSIREWRDAEDDEEKLEEVDNDVKMLNKRRGKVVKSQEIEGADLAQEDSPSGASRMSGKEEGGGLSEEEDEALAVV